MLANRAGNLAMTTAEAAWQESYQFVRSGIDARRSERGFKCALSEFARHVGLNERRVRSIYRGEVKRLWLDEAIQLRTKAAEWIAADIARQEAKIATMKAEIARLTGDAA